MLVNARGPATELSLQTDNRAPRRYQNAGED